MTSEADIHTPYWFVLNHFGNGFRDKARTTVDTYNATHGTDLQLFAPTYVVREQRDGRPRMRKANLTFHYIFLRGTLDHVKQLCSQDNGFTLLLDRAGTQRYATVSDAAMVNFKNIARAYRNCLPYFNLTDVDLQAGDVVEVINGDFPGLIGTYMPKARSNSGNIVLYVFNNLGTIAFDVKATDVRVLQFAPNTTRANDQIDAFVPHLLKALRTYHAGLELPLPLATRLSVFCSRMGAVRNTNSKLFARLQAILYAANHIIGDLAASRQALLRYDRLRHNVTNPWTLALADLLTAVIQSKPLPPLPAAAPASKAQTLLAAEYAHYLPAQA